MAAGLSERCSSRARWVPGVPLCCDWLRPLAVLCAAHHVDRRYINRRWCNVELRVRTGTTPASIQTCLAVRRAGGF